MKHAGGNDSPWVCMHPQGEWSQGGLLQAEHRTAEERIGAMGAAANTRDGGSSVRQDRFGFNILHWTHFGQSLELDRHTLHIGEPLQP